MYLKNSVFVLALGLTCFGAMAQTASFKVTDRDLPNSIVPNNATFFNVTKALAKHQKFLDIVNLTATSQEIIVRKSELILNVISASDKALASYCFGIFCRNADTFADTVNFLPGQTVPLEFDFFEASYPGHSLIRYTVSNKANANQSIGVYMDYEGVVGISTQIIEEKEFQVFPNPNRGIFYLLANGSKSLANTTISMVDALGKLIYEQKLEAGMPQELIELNVNGIAKGLYYLRVSQDSQLKLHQIISIE